MDNMTAKVSLFARAYHYRNNKTHIFADDHAEKVLGVFCDKGEVRIMKVLVLNGSPKKKSDTFRLTEAFLNGMNKEQENTVITINVFENDIAPCRGCFDCWSNMDVILP